jgi:hypothetical protein
LKILNEACVVAETGVLGLGENEKGLDTTDPVSVDL